MYTTTIQSGGKTIDVSVQKITESFISDDISRVYVIASDERGNIGIIYNSKRDIRGFPGGHKEPQESVLQVANREYIEEVGYDLSLCNMEYLIENKIDSDKTDKQVICFGKIGNKNQTYIEKDESVTKYGFFPIDEVIERLGNSGLRENILSDFINKNKI